MCARYTLRIGSQTIKDLFELDEVPKLPERFNIAPTQEVPAVTQGRDGERKLRMLRWGLVPHWAKSPAVGNQMINAKSETLLERPAFRMAFERRRCLLPADGFYEWKEVPIEDSQASLFGGTSSVKSGKTRKQPYHITLKDGSPFAFAGLWSRWSDPAGQVVDSCTIITTPANKVIEPIHDRMPAILQRNEFARWLDQNVQDVRHLQPLLAPLPSEEIKIVSVNPVVSNPKNDSPECIEPFNAA